MKNGWINNIRIDNLYNNFKTLYHHISINKVYTVYKNLVIKILKYKVFLINYLKNMVINILFSKTNLFNKI